MGKRTMLLFLLLFLLGIGLLSRSLLQGQIDPASGVPEAGDQQRWSSLLGKLLLTVVTVPFLITATLLTAMNLREK